jgi:phosphate starvation-inducible protein PhoH and related proteins
MTEGAIEIAPIGFMRGRTLNNAFIVIDEAQNCTYGQIKMMLTRLGWHSTMVVTGDPIRAISSTVFPGSPRLPAGSTRSPISPWCGWPRPASWRHSLVAELLIVL